MSTSLRNIVEFDLDTHISIDSHTATSGLRYFFIQIVKLLHLRERLESQIRKKTKEPKQDQIC
jgi:hypothetical protein